VRIQGTYLSEEEVEAITDHARTLGEPEYLDDEMFYDEDEEEYDGSGSEDPLMDKAIEIVLSAGKASASYIQRRLKVGYNRAARMVEEMERMGIVGPAQGSKPRDIIHVPDR
jgi:S-DNA-T family DNA segregation ATPase FtsK/SpoIIIE